MLARRAASSSSGRSASVMKGARRSVSGRLIPFSDRSFAPRSGASVIRATNRSDSTDSITPESLPSSKSILSPTRTEEKTEVSEHAISAVPGCP